MTFESVLREAEFSDDGQLLSKKHYLEVSINRFEGSCDVIFYGRSILKGSIKRPERLKVLLDIILEKR